jgi:hypothetical protein
MAASMADDDYNLDLDHDAPSGAEKETAEQRLAALLRDLGELHAYLEGRGRHTYDLAQRFLENARRDTASRTFDERQATMLDYQHYIWHEIAGLVNKLIVTYGDEASAAADEPPADNGAGAGT